MMRILQRHTLDDLAAYDEGQLDRRRADRVSAHLARCERCRMALEDVRHARRLMEALPDVMMPAEQVGRLRGLRGQPTRTAGRRLHPLAAVAALSVAVTGIVILMFVLKGRPDLVRAEAPQGLDDAANDLHERLTNGTLDLDLVTSDSGHVRRWQRAQGAPETALAPRITRADWPDVRIRGASIVRAGGARASVIAYDVDRHPVTLVTATETDVPGAPPGTWLSKRVYVRRNANGGHTLTWSTSGQTYSIVSSLPGVGETACLVCHSDPAFKRAVDRVAASLQASSRPGIGHQTLAGRNVKRQ